MKICKSQLNILQIKIFISISLCIFVNFYQVSAQDLPDTNHINTLYTNSKAYYKSGDYSHSIHNLNQILSVKSKMPNDEEPKYYKVYNRLGSVYMMQGNLNKALIFYKKALENTSDIFNLSVINGNIATIYTYQGDYTKAISYYENSLLILEKSDEEKKYSRIADNYHNLGFTYHRMGEYELALTNFLKSIQISEENHLDEIGETYYNFGLVYSKINKLNKADSCFKRAIKYSIKDFGENHYMTALAYMNYASFYTEIGEFAKSEKLYQKAHEIMSKTLGKKHPYTSLGLRNTGELHYQTKNYRQALNYYQQSLISKIQTFNDSSIYINPALDALPDIDLLVILKFKAQAFEKLAEQEDQEINLKAALSTLELCVSFIEQLRTAYLYESSKLKLAEKEHDTYLSIIRIAYSLYQSSGDKNYAETAFKYAELSKYATLREELNEESARLVAGVPDSICNKEQEIKEQIGGLRMLLEEENKLEKPDKPAMDKWNLRLFALSQELDGIIHKLESNYPLYYKQKYSNEVISLAQLHKALESKEAVIEYVLENNALYTFTLTCDSFLLTKQDADSTFYSNLDFYKSVLHSKHSSPYKQYRDAAYYLYQRLIKPSESFLENKNLLIIPDNKMEFIAFEAFIDKAYKPGDNGDYRNESYILRKYPMGYAYSSTLYLNSKNKKRKRNSSFLGIAPDYIASKDSLPYLPLSIKNVRKIAFLTLGKSLINSNATESNFKKYASSYDIIHLYAHGFEDSLNPSNSKICLSSQPDSIDDGYLHAWEAYNMQLQSQLVVLASCYSGAGKLSKGEGVLNIARSFINAGSQSVVMALWSASYESTIFEINNFYWNLLKGKHKDEALRLAKLKYLEQTDPINAHPRFWASLVITGSQEPLFYHFFLNRILIFVGLIVIVIFIGLRRLKNKSQINVV